jgi:hypothetical protein
MNTLLRWGKFNLVGAMGMGLQLASLALFNRWTSGHYLYASAAAIESRYCTTLCGTCTTPGATAVTAPHDSVSSRGSISPTVWFRCWETSP